MLKVSIIPGSLRKDSYNKSLASLISNIIQESETNSQIIDLSLYEIPLYNQDIEDNLGFPSGVTQIQQELVTSDLIIFVSPEYNGSIPGVLKNSIDWLSRPNPDVQGNVFRGKVAGIIASSPGYFGGIRVLRHLRTVLSHLGMIVLPDDRAFAKIDSSINQETLEFKDKEQLEQVIQNWILLTNKLV